MVGVLRARFYGCVLVQLILTRHLKVDVSETTHTYLGHGVKQFLLSTVVIVSRNCQYIHSCSSVAWLTWEVQLVSFGRSFLVLLRWLS
jgi:hypothetical protein